MDHYLQGIDGKRKLDPMIFPMRYISVSKTFEDYGQNLVERKLGNF